MKKKSNSIFLCDQADLILDSISEGIFTVDPNMKITYFNRAAENITRIKKKDAIGRYCFEVLRANICERNCPIKKSLQTGKEIRVDIADIIRNDGKKIPISLNSTLMKDTQGKTVGAVEIFRDLSPIEELRKEIRKTYTFHDIISKNHKILEIFNYLPQIAESDSTVLIEGPSGSGKELFARAIHNLSPRKNHSFIAVNCSALPETLLESELFGYMKGAFTDAKTNKPGRFALAQNGTLFLDEVDSLPSTIQVKLLRVLQEKEYEPLGATESVRSNVRVISATKTDLIPLIDKGIFRDDLYFRLNVIKIKLPPLSERRDDIPLLINFFIERFNKKMGKNIINISDDALRKLMNYDYPGNVRELENIIEHAFVMCKSNEIKIGDLPPHLLTIQDAYPINSNRESKFKDVERQIIIKTLQKNNGNKIQTAKDLGLHRSTLWRKIKKYKITQ